MLGRGARAKCSVCGREEVLAKIAGKHYCYECGSKLVKEFILSQVRELERRGIVVRSEKKS